MEIFNFEDLELIKKCLRNRGYKLEQDIKDWNRLDWGNIGDLQNMFTNESAFYETKENYIKMWKEELNKIEILEKKIEKYENE